ncbi:unnamed protein product [Amoebophrya sp. A120]|nr:unnamed protein product [Amoebophrya sp. A120]|eukprot:GSA120T00000312001.1
MSSITTGADPPPPAVPPPVAIASSPPALAPQALEGTRLDRFGFVGACESLLATSGGCAHSKEDLHSLFDFLTNLNVSNVAAVSVQQAGGAGALGAGAITTTGHNNAEDGGARTSTSSTKQASSSSTSTTPENFEKLLKAVGQLPKWSDEYPVVISSNSPLPKVRMWLLKHSWIIFDLANHLTAPPNAPRPNALSATTQSLSRLELEERLSIIPPTFLPKTARSELWRTLAVNEKVLVSDFLSAVLDSAEYRQSLKARLLKVVFRATKNKPGSLVDRFLAADAKKSGFLTDEQIGQILTATVGRVFLAKEDLRVLGNDYRQGDLVSYKELLDALRDEQRMYLEHALSVGFTILQQLAPSLPPETFGARLDAAQVRTLLAKDNNSTTSLPADDELIDDFVDTVIAASNGFLTLRAPPTSVFDFAQIPGLVDRVLPKTASEKTTTFSRRASKAGGAATASSGSSSKSSTSVGVVSATNKVEKQLQTDASTAGSAGKAGAEEETAGGSTSTTMKNKAQHLVPLLFFELSQTMRRNDISLGSAFKSLDRGSKGFLDFSDLRRAVTTVLQEEDSGSSSSAADITAEDLGVKPTWTLTLQAFEQATSFDLDAFTNALPSVFEDQGSLPLKVFQERMCDQNGIPVFELKNLLALIYPGASSTLSATVESARTVDRASCETFARANRAATSTSGGAGRRRFGGNSSSLQKPANRNDSGMNLFVLENEVRSPSGGAARGPGRTSKCSTAFGVSGSSAARQGTTTTGEQQTDVEKTWRKFQQADNKLAVSSFLLDQDQDSVDSKELLQNLLDKCNLTESECLQVLQNASALTNFYFRYTGGAGAAGGIAAAGSPTLTRTIKDDTGDEQQTGYKDSYPLRRLSLLPLITSDYDEHELEIRVLGTDLTSLPAGTSENGGSGAQPRYFLRYACHGTTYQAQTTSSQAGGFYPLDFAASHTFCLASNAGDSLTDLLIQEVRLGTLSCGLLLDVVRVLPENRGGSNYTSDGTATTGAAAGTTVNNTRSALRYLDNTASSSSTAVTVGRCVFPTEAIAAFLDDVAEAKGGWKAEALLGATWENPVPVLSSDGTRLGSVVVRLFYQIRRACTAKAPRWRTTFEGNSLLSYQMRAGGGGGGGAGPAGASADLLLPGITLNGAGAALDSSLPRRKSGDYRSAAQADTAFAMSSSSTGAGGGAGGAGMVFFPPLSTVRGSCLSGGGAVSRVSRTEQTVENTVGIEIGLSRGELNPDLFRRLAEQWYKSSLQPSVSTSVLDIQSVRVVLRIGLFPNHPKLQAACGGAWISGEPKPMSLASLLLGWSSASSSSGNKNGSAPAGAPAPTAAGAISAANKATAAAPAAAAGGPTGATTTSAASAANASTGTTSAMKPSSALPPQNGDLSPVAAAKARMAGGTDSQPVVAQSMDSSVANSAAKAAVASLSFMPSASASKAAGPAGVVPAASSTSSMSNFRQAPATGSSSGSTPATTSKPGYTALDFGDWQWQSPLLPPTPGFFEALKSDIGVIELWLVIEQNDEFHQLDRAKSVEVCLAKDTFPLKLLHSQLDASKAQSALVLNRKAQFHAKVGGPESSSSSSAFPAGGGPGGVNRPMGGTTTGPGAAAAQGATFTSGGPANVAVSTSAGTTMMAQPSSAQMAGPSGAMSSAHQQQLFLQQSAGEFLASVDVKFSITLPNADVMSLLYLTGINADSSGAASNKPGVGSSTLPAMPKAPSASSFGGPTSVYGGSAVSSVYGSAAMAQPSSAVPKPGAPAPGAAVPPAPAPPPLPKEITGHERKMLLRLKGAVVRNGMVGNNVCYYVEYALTTTAGATTNHRSLPLQVTAFLDAPNSSWAQLGPVDELVPIAIPAKPKTIPAPEQIVRVAAKLFQIGGSGAAPACIGEGSMTLYADVGAIETSAWGSFSSKTELVGKFLFSYQVCVPGLETDLRVDPTTSFPPLSGAAISVPSDPTGGGTTARGGPPAPMLMLPSSLVTPSYSIPSVATQTKWSWVLGHGPPTIAAAKKLRPPLELIMEVLCKLLADEQIASQGGGGAAGSSGGGVAAAPQPQVVNLITRIQDASYRKGGAEGTVLKDMITSIVPKCLLEGLMVSSSVGDDAGATSAAVKTSTTSSSSFFTTLLHQSVPVVHHLREKPMDALYTVEALLFYLSLRAVAQKLQPCWLKLRTKLFDFLAKNNSSVVPLRWSEFRRLVDFALAEADQSPLPESYWSFLRQHPTWWDPVTGVFDVVAFVVDLQLFPDIQEVLREVNDASAVDKNKQPAVTVNSLLASSTTSSRIMNTDFQHHQLERPSPSSRDVVMQDAWSPNYGTLSGAGVVGGTSSTAAAGAASSSSYLRGGVSPARSISAATSRPNGAGDNNPVVWKSLQDIEWLEAKLQNNLAQLEERVSSIKNAASREREVVEGTLLRTSRDGGVIGGTTTATSIFGGGGGSISPARSLSPPVLRGAGVTGFATAARFDVAGASTSGIVHQPAPGGSGPSNFYEQRWESGEAELQTYESDQLRALHLQNMAELDSLRKRMTQDNASAAGSGLVGTTNSSSSLFGAAAGPFGTAGGATTSPTSVPASSSSASFAVQHQPKSPFLFASGASAELQPPLANVTVGLPAATDFSGGGSKASTATTGLAAGEQQQQQLKSSTEYERFYSTALQSLLAQPQLRASTSSSQKTASVELSFQNEDPFLFSTIQQPTSSHQIMSSYGAPAPSRTASSRTMQQHAQGSSSAEVAYPPEQQVYQQRQAAKATSSGPAAALRLSEDERILAHQVTRIQAELRKSSQSPRKQQAGGTSSTPSVLAGVVGDQIMQNSSDLPTTSAPAPPQPIAPSSSSTAAKARPAEQLFASEEETQRIFSILTGGRNKPDSE